MFCIQNRNSIGMSVQYVSMLTGGCQMRSWCIETKRLTRHPVQRWSVPDVWLVQLHRQSLAGGVPSPTLGCNRNVWNTATLDRYMCDKITAAATNNTTFRFRLTSLLFQRSLKLRLETFGNSRCRIFTGRVPFLSTSQWCQSTEEIVPAVKQWCATIAGEHKPFMSRCNGCRRCPGDNHRNVH